jgi:hypothetical protein
MQDFQKYNLKIQSIQLGLKVTIEMYVFSALLNKATLYLIN